MNSAAVQTTRHLFLALWPDEDVQQQLLAHAGHWRWPPGCTRYAPADWHVTLHFMGEVDPNQVQDVATSAKVPFQPFELVLDQPALWPHGLAVLCASAMPMPLLGLHAQLGQALQHLGLPVETRPYRPHLTLALRADAAIVPTAPAPVVWPVKGFALVVSTGCKDQRYRVIHAYA